MMPGPFFGIVPPGFQFVPYPVPGNRRGPYPVLPNREAPYPVHPHRRCIQTVQTNRAPDSQASYRTVKRKFLETMGASTDPMKLFPAFLQKHHPELIDRHNRVYKPPRTNQSNDDHTEPDLARLQQLKAETKNLLVQNALSLEENQAKIRESISTLEEEKRLCKEITDQREETARQIKSLEEETRQLDQAKAKRESGTRHRKREIAEYLDLVTEKEQLMEKFESLEKEAEIRGSKINSREKYLDEREKKCTERERELEKRNLNLNKESSRLREAERKQKRDLSDLNGKKEELIREQKRINAKLILLEERELEYNTRSCELNHQEESIGHREEEYKTKLNELNELEERVKESREKFDSELELLRQTIKRANETQENVDERSVALLAEKAALVSEGETARKLRLHAGETIDKEIQMMDRRLEENKIDEALEIFQVWSTPAVERSWKLCAAAAGFLWLTGNYLKSYKFMIRSLSYCNIEEDRQVYLEVTKQQLEKDIEKLNNKTITPKEFLHAHHGGGLLRDVIDEVLLPEYTPEDPANHTGEVIQLCEEIRRVLTAARDILNSTLTADPDGVNMEDLTLDVSV